MLMNDQLLPDGNKSVRCSPARSPFPISIQWPARRVTARRSARWANQLVSFLLVLFREVYFKESSSAPERKPVGTMAGLCLQKVSTLTQCSSRCLCAGGSRRASNSNFELRKAGSPVRLREATRPACAACARPTPAEGALPARLMRSLAAQQPPEAGRPPLKENEE